MDNEKDERQVIEEIGKLKKEEDLQAELQRAQCTQWLGFFIIIKSHCTTTNYALNQHY